MPKKNSTTQQPTGPQSPNISRRSVLSSLGAGVAALGVGVGSTDIVKATNPSALSIDPNDWSVEPDEGSVSDASTPPYGHTGSHPYGINLSYDGPSSTAWESYSTTAKKTEDVDLKWEYSGNHAYYGAEAGVRISVNNDTTYLVGPWESVSGSFDRSGEITLSLNKGDEITVEFAGERGDYYNYYHGTLTLVPLHTNHSHGSSGHINHADSWSSSGPGTHNVSSGDNVVKFSYDSDDYRWQTWEYETTAQDDAEFDVDWNYDGHHSWWSAEAAAYIEVNGHRTKLAERETRGSFSASGKTRISVREGDTIRVILRGDHFDWSRIMRGTFTATLSKVGEGSPEPPEPSGPIKYTAESWSDSGPGAHSVSSGDNSVGFSYDYDDSPGTWEYETTAQGDADLVLDWNYQGNHADYIPRATASIYVNGERTELVDRNPRGPFSESGKTRISVSEGDTVRVQIYGYNYAYLEGLEGTFTATFSEV